VRKPGSEFTASGPSCNARSAIFLALETRFRPEGPSDTLAIPQTLAASGRLRIRIVVLTDLTSTRQKAFFQEDRT